MALVRRDDRHQIFPYKLLWLIAEDKPNCATQRKTRFNDRARSLDEIQEAEVTGLDNEMGIDPAIILPLADMRFIQVEAFISIVGVAEAILVCRCTTGVRESDAATRFVNSLNNATVPIISPCIPPMKPIFVMS